MQRSDITALLKEAKQQVQERIKERDAKFAAFNAANLKRAEEVQLAKDALVAFKGEKEALAKLNLPTREHDTELRLIEDREKDATKAAEDLAAKVQADVNADREAFNASVLAVKNAEGHVSFYQRMADRVKVKAK